MELDIGSTLNSEVLVLVLVDVKVLPGKEDLHPPDKVPESKPPPGAHAVDADVHRQTPSGYRPFSAGMTGL